MSTLSLPVGPGDHIRGPAGAPITLVEYGDFECPHCAAAAPVLRAALAEFGPRLRFVFRHYPIVISHRDAHFAAQASEAAAAQGKFWEMHDLLFQRQSSLSRESLLGYARELGLDADRMARQLDSGEYADRVDRDLESGDASGVRWTPTFYLNDDRLGPLPNPEQLLDLLRAV
jgi:formate-nitrite transporter family protein